MAKQQTETVSIPAPSDSANSLSVQRRPGPAEWNLIYFGILAVSMLVGVSSYVNGETVQVALLRFMVFFMVATALAMSFIAFVVVPLQLQRYRASLEERVAKAVNSEADRGAQSGSSASEEDRAMQNAVHSSDDVVSSEMYDTATVEDLDTILDLQNEYAKAQSVDQARESADDQASGLRRMAAAD